MNITLQMPTVPTRAILTTFAFSLIAFGCSDSTPEDVHTLPRETQAWENADLSDKNSEQLMAHLATLASVATSAADAGETVEFHHIEVALTATLDALTEEIPADSPALATIDSIKGLAVKLHIAGHDSNQTQGSKLSTAIAKLVAQLETQLAQA